MPRAVKDKNMEFEKQKIESFQRPEGQEMRLYRIEDDMGTLEIVQKLDSDHTEHIVRVKSDQSDWFELNSLLPDNCRICFDYTGAWGGYDRYEHDKRVVIINENEIRSEKWQYLATILHEIGHAVRASEKTQEVEEMLSIEERGEYKKDPELFKKFNLLRSRDERDAWSFAVRNLRKLKLVKKLFPDSKDLKGFIERKLRTYKESAVWRTSQMPVDVREDILKEISLLYIKEKENSTG